VLGLSKSSGTISIDLENKTVSVTGSESLIVTVGQQLAWICAACQHSQESLSSAHIRFNELTQRDVSPVGVPQFQIKTELVKVDSNEVKACWCNFLPNSVVAAGFPIRSRSFDETGLEIPMEIMAALGGIVNATEYDGGYVLKGRTIAFVPVGRQADSVQWHFVRSDGSRLHYKDLRTLQRLALADLKEKDLSTTRTFLGWCNSVVNHYGMKDLLIATFLILHGYPLVISLILARNSIVQLQNCAATNQPQNDIWEGSGTHGTHKRFYWVLQDRDWNYAVFFRPPRWILSCPDAKLLSGSPQ